MNSDFRKFLFEIRYNIRKTIVADCRTGSYCNYTLYKAGDAFLFLSLQLPYRNNFLCISVEHLSCIG